MLQVVIHRLQDPAPDQAVDEDELLGDDHLLGLVGVEVADAPLFDQREVLRLAELQGLAGHLLHPGQVGGVVLQPGEDAGEGLVDL